MFIAYFYSVAYYVAGNIITLTRSWWVGGARGESRGYEIAQGIPGSAAEAA